MPRYIDCNPRLVEPMSARLADLDLADLLVKVSLGEAIEPVPGSREGVRTHLAMQALFGCALRSGSRRDLGRESWRLLAGRGPYRGSREELTPARLDWPSVLPAHRGGRVARDRPRSRPLPPAPGLGRSPAQLLQHALDRRRLGAKP